MKANLSNPFLAIEYMEVTISIRGANSNGLTLKCLSHTECAITEGYLASRIYLPDNVRSVIQHRWQFLRERTGTGFIPFADTVGEFTRRDWKVPAIGSD